MTSFIAVFAKTPIPGRVKTRLARDLGAEYATSLYRAMLEDLWHKLEGLSTPRHYFVDSASALFPWKHSRLQRGDSLAQRMYRAFAELFSEQHDCGVLLGSDIPTLRSKDILDAFEALRRYDAVLAPTADGGYGLIGLRSGSLRRTCFEALGAEEVCRRSVEALEAENLSVCLLDTHQDIDTSEDLQAFLAMESAKSCSPILHKCAEAYYNKEAHEKKNKDYLHNRPE